jgi:dTDP-4-dehydrorhamnose reductase
MRVFVTGVTGQVGSTLVGALAQVASVVMANRNQLDLARPEEIASALERNAADLIINPAAYTAVGRAEDEREMAFHVNADAPGAMARWAAARGVPLIHFSTDYVFDGVGKRPWREHDATNPLSAYGSSKLVGEDAVRSAAGPHLIVRTSWVYAAKATNVFATIVRLAKEHKELRIVADQVGAPTSARLIADVVGQRYQQGQGPSRSQFRRSGGYGQHCGTERDKLARICCCILEGLKARGVASGVESIVPITTKNYPTEAKRPANCRLDLPRLRRVFRIDPPTWDQALAAELEALVGELMR